MTLSEADMKILLIVLRFVVVGFALLVGGRVLYRNRDRLKREWRTSGRLKSLGNLSARLSPRGILGSVGPFRNLTGQPARPR